VGVTQGHKEEKRRKKGEGKAKGWKKIKKKFKIQEEKTG
jgi:hypothetical protein